MYIQCLLLFFIMLISSLCRALKYELNQFIIYFQIILEKELTIKLQENKHLRNEILALQNKTPPHFNHGDSMQMQRRLKADIEHLEAYIKKLEKEQYDLEEQLQHKTELVSIICFCLKIVYCYKLNKKQRLTSPKILLLNI